MSLTRGIGPAHFRRAGIALLSGVRRPVTSTLASVALVLGALAGAVVVAPPALAACNSASFGGGTGTSSDPFLVDSQAALIATDGCGGNDQGNFLQTQDITLTGIWTPLNNYEAWVKMYDGGGFSILGLDVNASSNHAGLWSRWQQGGSVSNLTLVSPQVTSTAGGNVGTGFFVGELNSGATMSNVHVTNGTLTSNSSNIGGLVGNLNTQYFTISDSSVNATITSNGSANNTSVGGLVGKQGFDSLIQRSSSSGALSASASLSSGTISGAGGLVGYSDGRILNTYSTVDVTATNAHNVGGLVGRSVCNSGDLNDSYAIGAVSGRSGSSSVGGLVGQANSASCDQTDSVWDTGTSGQSNSAVGTGRTTLQMKSAITYTARGWSTSVWDITDGSYPTFVTPGSSISPSSLDFGSQGVLDGATTASTVTLSSTGGATLVIASPGITISGTDAADFSVDGSSTCADGASVAPAATCTVEITFDPSTSGSKTATLTVATDADTETVSLSGTGVASAQTVTWAPTTAITAATTTPSSLAATDGDGAISYAVASAGTTGCTVNSSTAVMTFSAAGSCEITATAAATSTYAVGAASVTFVVSRAPQPITVSAASSTLDVYSSTTLSTSGVLGSGQVTYSESSSGTVCSLAGTTLTAVGEGTCTVTSGVAADAAYEAATSSGITITVQKAVQTVTWTPANTSVLFTDSPVTPSSGATTDGDGAVTYAVTSGTCSVNSNTGTLTYSAAGTCVVTATAAATTAYSAGTKSVTFTIAPVAPTKPTITSVSAGDTTATVAFAAPSSNGGASITSYTATASGGGGSATCVSSPCTITGLTNGVGYTITVVANNSAGTGSASDTSPSVSPATSTGEVQNLGVLPGNTTLAVSWTAPACLLATPSTCGSLINYEVFTKPSGGSYTSAGTTSLTSMTVASLVNGTQYDVKVTVTTSSSSADAFAQQVPATTPSAPTGVTVSRLTATSVSVGWTAPASDGGQPVIGYTVTATSSDNVSTVTASPSSSPVTLTGLSDAKTYTVVVSATNLMGPGSNSTSSGAVTMGLTAQTITAVPATTTMTALSSILLASSGSSGSGAKTFAVSPGDPCTVSGAVLTATATGTCTVTVTIAADVLTAAATSTGVSVTVNPAIQTVSWSPTTVFTMTETPVALAAASASAGGALTYSVSLAGTAGCSFPSGSTLAFTSTGTCTVQVSAGSTSTHAASSAISLTITTGLATRAITWSPITTLEVADSGSAASPLASISTGAGTPAYAVSSAGATGCTVNSSSAVISFTAPGTCIIAATAPANSIYAVTSTSVTFTITSAPQTVSWSPTTALTVSQSPVTFAAATGSGGGAVTYAVVSQGGSNCSVTSATRVLTFTAAGQCLVRATAGVMPGYASGTTSVTFIVSGGANSASSSGQGAGLYVEPQWQPSTKDAAKQPGDASLIVGTTSVPMTITANNTNTGLVASMGQWQLTIEPTNETQAMPLQADGVLETWSGQNISVAGESYMRRTTVNIYMMSTPILVGSVTTDSAGSFSTNFMIPTSMNLGTHTIQVIGTNPGNELSQASVGVLVVEEPSVTLGVESPIGTQIGFMKKRAAVNKRSIVALQSLVGQLPDGSQANIARVVISVPKATKRSSAKALAKKRAAEAVGVLRSVGYEGPVTTRVTTKRRERLNERGSVTLWFSTTA